MFATLLSAMRGRPGNDEIITRRRHDRRTGDKCVCVINGKTYPVVNWSLGGLLVYGDSRPFAVDNEINVTLRFKLRNDIIDIPHKGVVVRKARDKIAFEFMPLTRQIRKNLQSVIDDFVATRFADSQLS